jgi:excisionase family DNA binding protein
MVKNKYLTIPQLAELLGISRIAVYKKVKKGQIRATKIGRTYMISDEHITSVLNQKLSAVKKRRIEAAVKKTVREYGQLLKLLGRQ